MASEETYAKAEAAGKTALTEWFNTPPPGGGNPHTMMIRAACDVGIAEGRKQAADEIAERLRIRLQAAQDAADVAAYGEDEGQAYHDAGEAWALKQAIRFVEEVGRGA